MRNRILAAAACAALLGLAPMASATTTVAADWEMNENYSASIMQAGPTVMHDSAGNHDGTIPKQDSADGQQITTNGSDYSWKDRCPACYPPDLTRVIQVPDAADGSLDFADTTQPYTLEFRFKTSHPFGNYMQKGQATTAGGQIKVQGPKGNVQCLFKGPQGSAGTGSTQKYPALDDGQWHTVKCVHTATETLEYVDSHTQPIVKKGVTGPIDNAYPFTIGGKPKCDQVKVTCDYFSGSMDYVKISHG